MTALDFLDRLKKLGVELWLEDGNELCFRAKKGVMTAEIKQQLRDHKADIVRILASGDQAAKQPRPPIEPGPRGEPAPLSYAQERLWFLDRLEPGGSAYNMPMAFRFEGELDRDILARCFRELARRHDALRTRFVMDDDAEQPLQVVDPPGEVHFQTEDFRGDAPQEQRLSAALDALEAEALRPFDLERGPLLRVTLYRIDDDLHVVLLNTHHIISDGWSLNLFFREFGELYRAYAAGKTPELEPAAVQYADYARWQRGWLDGEALDRQLDYWARQLDGAPPLLDLPLDFPRPATQTFNGRNYGFQIPDAVAARVQAINREHGLTPFMVYGAAFAEFLGRMTRQRDVCIGTVSANRNHSGIENTFGFFVNTLVLRFDLGGRPSFNELLARTRRMTLDAYAHQEAPFGQVVERVQPERDLSHPPLFQVGFSVDTLDIDANSRVALPGVAMSIQPFESQVAKQDIGLHFLDYGGHSYANFEYNVDLFKEASVAAMADLFISLLERLLAEPDRPMAALPTLTGEARATALAQWARRDGDYPRDRGLHQLVADWAAKNPDAPALQHDEQTLSYRELDQRANRIAQRLIAAGVGVEDRVGALLSHSFDLIAALLGILKAGAAYVPLDLLYPPERIADMAADAGMACILAGSAQLGFDPGAPVIPLGDLDDRPSDDPARPFLPGQLAYLMYTSGSTGRPKGAAVTHQNLLRLTHDAAYVRLGPGDAVAQTCHILFDPFCFEVWAALTSGAKLALINPDALLETDQLDAAFRQAGVNTLLTTAALVRQIAETRPAALSRMKTVVFGGEKAPVNALRAVMAEGAPENLINAYGPTEATVAAIAHRLTAPPAPDSAVPIGAPLTDVAIYLTDAALQPVPRGVAGEICIGGDGVARGYFGRPALTAQSFVPDPFGARRGARLYRSGDLARALPDGALGFIGRADHQVKLRGFRVELGEIEQRLRASERVTEAVALVRDQGTAAQKLIAYLTTAETALHPLPADADQAAVEAARASRETAVQQLRRDLAAVLPDYMIPSAFVFLARFPLTPNAKIDLKALPAPDEADLHGDAAFEPAESDTEKLVAEIWAELLKLDRVGMNDHFFNIGGHSLLATRLIAKLKQRLQLGLPIRIVFEHPIARDLARHIDLALWSLKRKNQPVEKEADGEEGEI